MKIGVLTYHRAINYGAFLQAYGLCQRLNEEPDIEAEIIDFQMQKEIDVYAYKDDGKFSELKQVLRMLKHYSIYRFDKNKKTKFKEALEEAPLSKERLVSDDIAAFQEFVRGKYDYIIAGSDEIWKLDGVRGFPTPYWLPGDLGCKKLSYAASSRNDFSTLDPKTIDNIKALLSEFSYISVRDELTYANITEYIKPEAEVKIYADPSFIYDYKPDKERGKKILAEKARVSPNKKTAVVMLGKTNDAVVKHLADELSDEYNLVAVFERHPHCKNLWDITPFEWLDVIAAADIVCASFFHAICFSIVCGTPFLAFNLDNRASKLYGILKESDNLERLVDDAERVYQDGYIKGMIKKYSVVCNGTEYVRKSREYFSEYVSLIH